MDIQNALKILSDVLGFDCSSFEEVVDNGILRSLSSSLEYAKENEIKALEMNRECVSMPSDVEKRLEDWKNDTRSSK